MPEKDKVPAEVFTRDDRDLLIRMSVKVDNLIDKVDALTNDHEKRLRILEQYVWKAIGAIIVAEIALGWWISIKK